MKKVLISLGFIITLTGCMSQDDTIYLRAKLIAPQNQKVCYTLKSESNPELNGRYCLEYVGER